MTRKWMIRGDIALGSDPENFTGETADLLE
jgi:hypothetical protein